MTWVTLGAGAAALYLGTLWFVGGISRLALSLRAPRLIAVTAAAASGGSVTSIAVALQAAAAGHGDLALGALLGANAANLGLVVALTVIARPAQLDGLLARREAPVLLVATYAVLAVLVDGRVTPLEATVLLLGAVCYVAWAPRWLRCEALLEDAAWLEVTAAAADAGAALPGQGRGYAFAAASIGLGAAILGGQLLAAGAAGLMESWHLTGMSIGPTVVAAGVALPGLVTSAVLTRRGKSSVAVGNALASSIFTALLGLGAVGLTGTVAAHPDALLVHIPGLAMLTLLSLFFVWSRQPLRRWKGALLLAGYVAYTVRLLGR